VESCSGTADRCRETVQRNMDSNIDFGSLVREDLTNYGGASNLAFNEKVKALQNAGQEIYHFAFGQSPFPVPQPFVKHLKETAEINDYLSVAGLLELREEIVEFHKEWDGASLSVDSLIVGPGSKELIYLTMAVFKGQIWLPAPAWTTYKPQACLAGHKARTISQPAHQKWKLRAGDVETAVKDIEGPHLMVLTNPGNPSGCAYSREELEALTTVFRKYKVIVLSDEIYARLNYEDNHVCMSNIYPEGTILTSGFSKWSSAGGWRLGYAHFPDSLQSLKKGVLSGASHTYSCAPANIQHAVARALKQDKEELRNYILAARTILSVVAKYCQNELALVGVEGHAGKAGYYFMPDFSNIRSKMAEAGIKTGQAMCDDMLKSANVALMPSSSFLLSEDDLSVRFCYVIFDGAKCMKEREALGDNHILGDAFVKEFCPELVRGVQSLCKWVNEWKKQ